MTMAGLASLRLLRSLHHGGGGGPSVASLSFLPFTESSSVDGL